MNEGCAVVAAAVVIGIALSAVGGFVFMLLWNAVVPAVFGLSALTFWQAWGLALLLHLIGGSFRATVRSSKD